MATRKKNDTLLWVAGLGIAGYLFYQYKEGKLVIPGLTQPVAAPAVNTTVPNASGTLLLPPSNQVNSNVPAIPVTNAPTNAAVNMTNLVPAQVNNGQLVPNQAIALNPNGTPVINNQGMPMVFAPVQPSPANLYSPGGPLYNNTTTMKPSVAASYISLISGNDYDETV